MTIIRSAVFGFTALSLSFIVSGCSTFAKKDDTAPVAVGSENRGFLGMFGGSQTSTTTTDASIGVNAYLWRASLDTISFMPLASADPWGGVIISDWYANPEKPDERFKTTVYILDSRLRADALNVTVNKQVMQNGGWIDSAVSAQTEIDVENAILTRARQLRLSNVNN